MYIIKNIYFSSTVNFENKIYDKTDVNLTNKKHNNVTV